AAFRGGTAGASIVEASTAATANLDQAGRAVEVAQQALDTLQAEAEITQRELGRCPRSRRQARTRRSRKGRLCDRQSGGRHNSPTARIFTTSTLAAMHLAPTDRPTPGKRRLARFHRPADGRSRSRTLLKLSSTAFWNRFRRRNGQYLASCAAF